MKKFKNKEEVNKFFKHKTVKFSFMSDQTIFLKTVSPHFTNDDLVHFELSFYYEGNNDFFCYEDVEELNDRFQISQVTMISQSDNSTFELFFAQYKENKLKDN
tara:strand:- start:47 stop:355 length:309 start_codon:yes stop_codon:yes gene_type:complete